MRYVLENNSEFERLEKQSQTEAFDFKVELAHIEFTKSGTILDAGCGSGIVTRHLAALYPESKITGCDFSNNRVNQARSEAKQLINIEFCQQDLTQMTFAPGSFDEIVCRFVLEHLPKCAVVSALKEMYRCLKPGGKICLIDMDGCPANIYPQTDLMQKFFHAFETKALPDMRIGKKLPHYLKQGGFSNINWIIHTSNFIGESLATETEQIEARFQHTFQMVVDFLGCELQAKHFIAEYMDTLKQPGTTLFYNKFIVTAEKPLGIRLL
ncbi:MAG: methyltransferase domain-containing protein [Bdellovibrionales bacterium]|nr:methyltransferase domain-containing protein [Oligoflexia bacterium]